jgi:hypothetical protein
MLAKNDPLGHTIQHRDICCNRLILKMVGERGFEPPTPWSRTRCSTRLSHSPTWWKRDRKQDLAWCVQSPDAPVQCNRNWRGAEGTGERGNEGTRERGTKGIRGRGSGWWGDGRLCAEGARSRIDCLGGWKGNAGLFPSALRGQENRAWGGGGRLVPSPRLTFGASASSGGWVHLACGW